MQHPLRLFRRFAVVCAAVSMSIGAAAQTNVAQLSGRITDPSGGALPGATVTATSEQTGLVADERRPTTPAATCSSA